MKHTPTPWEDKQFRSKIMASEQFYLDWADWNHAKTCVNACEGINPEAVPKLLDVVQNFVRVCNDAKSGADVTVVLEYHQAKFEATIALAKPRKG